MCHEGRRDGDGDGAGDVEGCCTRSLRESCMVVSRIVFVLLLVCRVVSLTVEELAKNCKSRLYP